MKFLIIDTALTMDLARRLRQDGHEVYYYVNWFRTHPEVFETQYGNGFFEEWGVKSVKDYLETTKKVDCVVISDVGMIKDVDMLRKQGVKVFGASSRGQRLEFDRGYAKEVFKKNGLLVPKSWSFSTVAEGIKTIEKEKKAFVVKGDESMGMGEAKTYVGRAPEDTIFFLEQWREKVGEKVNYIMEEVIDGVEVAVGGFFNGTEFVNPVNINFEFKRLFPNCPSSVLTGEMGTCVRSVDKTKCRFFQHTLGKMEKFLAESYGAGYFDLNCIATKEGLYILEATCRFGIPTIQIQQNLHLDDMGKLLAGCANGTAKEFKSYDGWATGVCLVAGGYPYDEAVKRSDWSVIFGVDEALKAKRRVNPIGVIKDDKKLVRVLPGMGILLVCTGLGKTLGESMNEAYDTIESLYLKDGCYRDDIGVRLFTEREDLKRWGLLTDDAVYNSITDAPAGAESPEPAPEPAPEPEGEEQPEKSAEEPGPEPEKSGRAEKTEADLRELSAIVDELKTK